MRVRYTPDVFRFQVAGGVSRYFVELTQGLRGRGVDARISAGLHINDLLEGVEGVSGLNVRHVGPGRARQAATKVIDYAVTASVLERLGRGDIVHPSWYPPSLERLPRRSRLVVTVFDMIPERHPELSVRSADATAAKRAWVKAADHVLVISEHTRRDLVELFEVDPTLVTVTPLAPTVARPAPPSVGTPPPDGPFLLYVGDRRPAYKNFRRLLEALTYPVVPAEVALVCVGAPTASRSELDLLDRLGIADRVSFRSATDAELSRLYRAAAALVYPSLYEGFGLPPLEAMVCRCPVVAADVASIPEVVGDAGLLVDPTDVGALGVAIAEVMESSTRARLVAAGERRVAAFTWSATVDGTLEAYRAVVGVAA